MNNNKGNSSIKIFVTFVIILAISAAGYAYNRRGNMLKEKTYEAIKTNFSGLKEREPVLSPSSFSGKAAYAYQLAGEIPEVLDRQFCYCYCRKKHDHKNLLTCFTSDHGAKCKICIDEVIMANNLLRKGYDIDRITETIDDVFGKLARAHNN